MDHCCNMLCFFVNATIRIPEVPVPRPVTHLLGLSMCLRVYSPGCSYDAFLRFFLGILKLLGP